MKNFLYLLIFFSISETQASLIVRRLALLRHATPHLRANMYRGVSSSKSLLSRCIITRLVQNNFFQLYYMPVRTYLIERSTDPRAMLLYAKEENIKTQFMSHQENTNTVLTYATVALNSGKLSELAHDEVNQALDRYNELSVELREGLAKELTKGDAEWVNYMGRKKTIKLFSRLDLALQVHYARIITHVLDNNLPYKREKCEIKCPKINFETRTEIVGQSEVIVTVVKIEEYCLKQNNAISRDLVEKIFDSQTIEIKKVQEQFEAIKTGKTILLSPLSESTLPKSVPGQLKASKKPEEILQVSKDATEEEIKRAYFERRYAIEKKLHKPEELEELQKAYLALRTKK